MSRDRVSGLFWLTLAIAVAGQSFTLKLGTLNQPGPGFFPFWGAVVLGTLSVILLVGAPSRDVLPSTANIRVRVLLIVVGALLGYVLLLEILGFVTVTFLFLLLLFRLVRKGWATSGLAALAGASASYALFQLWLKTQLPRGPFGF
jgi:putative tricarboxylic transport membrane protein